MAGSSIFGFLRRAVSPFAEAGVSGTAIFGGAISRQERNPQMIGQTRWKTAADILTNMSIVAAGTRYYLNLLARPAWSLDPADDTPEAKAVAELMDSIIQGTDTSWSRTVRRGGLYCYQGFGFHEWVAKKRDDGKIGLKSIEPRPAHTIGKWDLDENGSVQGVVQNSPQDGHEIYLPRQKLVYFVDDALTDSPEGMGWFRHLADPANRLKAFLKHEGIGFQRDMAGVPVGRAPIAAMQQAVKEGVITQAEMDGLIAGLEQFVQAKIKQEDTSLLLDSQPFTALNADGTKQISQVMQWGVELLTGNPGSIEALGKAISRTTWDMALIMGIQSMLIGREGAGSMALATDASRNLFLNVNSTLGDMAEGYDRDLIGPMMAMNGIDEKLRPTLKVADASFRDVEQIAKVLADMSSAGAILSPDDPAIDDVRDLAGVSRQPEMTPDRMDLMRSMTRDPFANPTDPTDPNNPNPPKGAE